MSTFIVADIGINHNGNLNIVKELIDVAVFAKCDAVKFQKRTITDVYSPEELDVPRESPFGTTNREQKEGLELSRADYDEIDRYCKEKGIEWYASAWDIKSQGFLKTYNLRYNKVASAMLTIKPLLTEIAEEKKYTFISTGMSTMDEIGEAVDLFRKFDCPFELMHCNSTYPMPNEDANLNIIQVLKDKFDCKVGYSGHERGLQISLAAAALGATSIERHITLDVAMYGSDQPASLEPQGFIRLVRDIKIIESAMGEGQKTITKGEEGGRKKLANPYWYKSING
ncbi:N-acetylneuraminate synthase [Candidatus Marinimicrobia bacterium MT.SAG.4]|nr:N-acetylneuraminate synthase [Candidatus Marinimicrobia bacterium MT.SAG.4]